MSGGIKKKFQILLFLNNFSFIKFAEKSVPGVADVGAPHGGKDGPITPPWLEGSGKVSNNQSYYS